MKLKSIMIIGLILFTLCSISAIYADTYVTGNSTFSLPDGYTLQEKGNQVVIYNDEYVITMYEGPIISTDEAKEKRIGMGYNLIGERDYEFDGAEINQQNYNKEGITTCIYTVEKNNQTYIISLNVDDTKPLPEYEDNPVTQIIDTLEPKS